jgi:hypothetical protein
MKREGFAAAAAIILTGLALAQSGSPPKGIPTSLPKPERDKPPAPSDAAKQRQETIKGLKEELRPFDPDAVSVRRFEGRWLLQTRTEVLKDFGLDRDAAVEAGRIIQDLRVNQLGSIPGARPPFEYWLVDGKAPKTANGKQVFFPVVAGAIRVESVGGAWVVTDGAKALYDFGTDADAAKRAAVVFWKYGFNQVSVIGSPRPTMLYPVLDPRQAATDRAGPMPERSPVGVASDVSRTSLLLPGNVYAGPKDRLDVTKLQVARNKAGEWTLSDGGDVLGRFGSSETAARAAMKVLQETKATEVVRIGEARFPLFLTDGNPVHGDPLGVAKVSIRSDRMKITKVRETWWVFEDTRPLTEVGTKEDAELVAKVIQHFELKTMCTFGRPETGGLRLLTAGR